MTEKGSARANEEERAPMENELKWRAAPQHWSEDLLIIN